ncbi:hypothetical protein BGW80DRAFT_1247051 [Lactifluus volemus]|nr:hypothetical protein BGW80DRAFT_1247051 [Lactifluus volemus]
MAYGASIIIIAFPSKTTHKLQPLDVGVFGCLQKKCNDSNSDFELLSDSDSVAKDNMEPILSTSCIMRSLAPSLSWLTLPPILSYNSMVQSSPDDLWKQLQFHHAQNKALLEMYQDQTWQLEAANTHCTIAERKVAHFAEKLANKGKKVTLMKKVDGQFAKKAKKEQADAWKKAEKKAEDDTHTAQIAQDPFRYTNTMRNFVILAGALGLEQGGTIASLQERIKAYLNLDETRSALAHHPHFNSLFGGPSKTWARQVVAMPLSYEANAPPPDLELKPNSLLN